MEISLFLDKVYKSNFICIERMNERKGKIMKKETRQSVDTFRILFFITLIEICLTWMFNGIDTFWCLKLALNAIIGNAAIILLFEKIERLKQKEKDLENQKDKRWIIAIGYLVSLFWIILSIRENVYELWMFGSIWIAFLVSPYLAIGYHAIFAYLYCILNQTNAEYFVLYVILGWIICGLTECMKKKKTLPISIIILISSHITIILLTNHFRINLSTWYYILYSIISFIAELALIMAIHFVKEQREHTTNTQNSEKNEEFKEKSIKARYKMLLNVNFPLVKKIEERSKYLYKHSLRVAVASGEAAKLIGANEQLAQVGGLYHDIGKTLEGNYIENGKKLALEYGLPEDVIVIIESHNIKYSKPKTVEAAIIMFADSIVSAMEVLQARHGDLTKNRQAIIRKIFEVRFEDGTLDDSGLSFHQYRTLMKYFEEHNF